MGRSTNLATLSPSALGPVPILPAGVREPSTLNMCLRAAGRWGSLAMQTTASNYLALERCK